MRAQCHHDRATWALLALSALFALLALLPLGCDHAGNGGQQDMSAEGDGGSNLSCVPLAQTCNVSGDCCVGRCDGAPHSGMLGGGGGGGSGGGGGGACAAQGADCTSPIQCCGLSCIAGKCGSL